MRAVVLTHFHDDHAGSGAEVAPWAGAPVITGRGDAAFVRGRVPGPIPVLTTAEEVLHAVVAADLTPAPPCPVAQGVSDGDVSRVLIARDTTAEHQGQVVLSPFNTERAGACASLQCPAPALMEALVCPGFHGVAMLGLRPPDV